MTEALRVGFVGLGDQGAPMAERILAAGFPLAAFARRPEVMEHFSGLGARSVESLHELGKVSDLVEVCVVDDAQVNEVVLGDGILAGMRPGGVLAIHSTVHPTTCRELYEEAQSVGVAVLDAPVTGGGSVAARNGTLAVPVGGDADAFERCRPVFQTFARSVHLMGPIGSGQLTKLVNNYLFAVQISTAFEAARLSRDLGLDLEVLAELLPNFTCAGWVMTRYAWSGFTHVVPPHDKGRVYSRGVFGKDVRIMREVLAERQIDREFVEASVSRGLELLESDDPLVFDPSVDIETYRQRIKAALASAPTMS